MMGAPVIGDLDPRRAPDVPAALDIVDEPAQGHDPAGPPDETAMKAHRHHLGCAGRAFGIVSTGFNIGSIIGPMIYGLIMDFEAPRWVFAVSALFMVLTVLLALVTGIVGVVVEACREAGIPALALWAATPHYLAANANIWNHGPAGEMSVEPLLALGACGDQLEPLLAELSPPARCGLDLALHDWWGKRLGQPLHRLWSLDPGACAATSVTLGLAEPAAVLARLRREGIGYLLALYVTFNKRKENDPDLQDAARAKFKALEEGDGQGGSFLRIGPRAELVEQDEKVRRPCTDDGHDPIAGIGEGASGWIGDRGPDSASDHDPSAGEEPPFGRWALGVGIVDHDCSSTSIVSGS